MGGSVGDGSPTRVPEAIDLAEPPSASTLSESVSAPLGFIECSEVPRLPSIWAFRHSRRYSEPNDPKRAMLMTCLACGAKLGKAHATRLMNHFMKKIKRQIAICTATLTKEDQMQLYDLSTRSGARKVASEKRGLATTAAVAARVEAAALSRMAPDDASVELVRAQQVDVTATELEESSLDARGGLFQHYPKVSSSSTGSVAGRSGKSSIVGASSTGRSFKKNTAQRTIENSIRNQTADERIKNECRCDAAISDFVFGCNVPPNLAERKEFKHMIWCARQVSSDYAPPGRKKLSYDLLRDTYKSTEKANYACLEDNPEIFGISLQSDGATIKRMPLVNVIGHNINKRPVCLGLVDCTGHLAAGGKKDASFLAEKIITYLQRVDKGQTLVDLVMFDGASNVQNAGKIIKAFNPRIYVIKGGEHCSGLFFGDIAKLHPIKVRVKGKDTRLRRPCCASQVMLTVFL